MSWGLLRSKSKGVKSRSGLSSYEQVEEEDMMKHRQSVV